MQKSKIENTLSKKRTANEIENAETVIVCTTRNSDCGGYRLLYLHGGARMKEAETAFYENYCLRCKFLPHCPWRCISGDTCLELTRFEECNENENDNERKETV